MTFIGRRGREAARAAAASRKAADTERVLELVANQTQARLDQQLSDFDALDTKTLGVLGADAAALGVVIATHSSLNHLWWIPAIPLSAAGLMLTWAVRPRGYDEGPEMEAFFTGFGGSTYQDVALQVLRELFDALKWNKNINTAKAKTFKRAFRIFVVGLIGAFLVGLFR